jgi:hypothetical protein
MNSKKIFKRTLLSSALLSAIFQVSADDGINHLSNDEFVPPVSTDAGMIESLTGFSINDTSFMQKTGFEVGMWASGGITYASHNRSDHNNAPLSFNDRNSEFLFNQLNFYIERAVNKGGTSWDVGGRMDFMYGTDASKTQAINYDNDWWINEDGGYYNIAMPQLYLEVYAPFGNGVTAKVGHFYTTIGYEVVPSPDNFFYSHSYTMLYGEPFTHNGVTFSYDIDDNFSINAGAVMGWDNMTTHRSAWSFLGGVNWVSNSQATSVAVQLITGDPDENQSGNRTMYSIVATHDITENWHYVFQHDFGTQQSDRAATDDDGRVVATGGPYPGSEAGNWFGINQYLTYDITDQIGIGLRAEWFNDKGGAHRVNAVGANYLAASFGVNYSPVPWFTFRPEVRYDWADEDVFNIDSNGVGVDNDQVTVAMDMIVTF